MHLREYLADPKSLTVSALRHRMNEFGAKVDHDAQLRQWIQRKPDGSYKRKPNPANAYALELATDGKVTRKDMRPTDWQAIWPELVSAAPTPAPGRKATSLKRVR